MSLPISYYYLKDKKIIGKLIGLTPYYYNFKSKSWEITQSNELPDYLVGYDGEDIGCYSELSQITEITEEEAVRLQNEGC